MKKALKKQKVLNIFCRPQAGQLLKFLVREIKQKNHGLLVKPFSYLSALLTALVLLIALVCIAPLAAQTDEPLLPLDKKGRLKALSLQQIVRLVLEKNSQVHIQQLEIIKSDTALLKDEAQYSPVLEGGLTKRIYKNRYSGSFTSGNRVEENRVYLKAKKLFSSGTYFELEASDSRTGAEETDDALGGLGAVGGDSNFEEIFPPATLHVTALTLLLRQELLKNAFGYSQRRINDINRNLSKIQRENLTYQLAALVVEAMIDYWSLALAEESTRTSERLLRNVRNIRNITLRKRRLGLAEAFEINQWDALLASSRSSLEQARLERDSQRRTLLRILNLDPQLQLSGASQLVTELPKDFDFDRDLETAYEKRPDFKALELEAENARKSYQIAENRLLPSVTLSGSYSGRGFDRRFNEATDQSLELLYPEATVQFQVEYPLWDEDARVDARNARIDLQRIGVELEQQRRQIRDEISEGLQQIQVAYRVYRNAQRAYRSTNAFYRGLIAGYRRGRFTATAAKEALDSLVQADLARTMALVNYNIALVRYDLTRNVIFQKYDVDIDAVIDRMLPQFQE